MNKLAIAQALGIILAIFHIMSHSWLFNDIEEKSGSDKIVVGLALLINIGMLIMVSVKIAKARGIKMPKIGKKPVAAAAELSSKFI